MESEAFFISERVKVKNCIGISFLWAQVKPDDHDFLN
jgi:hypothetical protein